MKICHLTAWLSARGGGIPPVVRALQRRQQWLGADVRIAGLADPGQASLLEEDELCGRVIGPAAFGYSPQLRAALAAARPAPEVAHVHGLWMYPGALARRWAARAGARRVVSPHGMLEPWALRNSRWKKRLAAWAFENRNLRAADCLHALCSAEVRNIRRRGLANPVAVIPNGVDLAEFVNPPGRGALEARFPSLQGRRWMLFLSRIHPKKGLAHLLRAWSAVLQAQPAVRESWTLVIAGPDEIGHEEEMKRLAAALGLAWRDQSPAGSASREFCSVLFSGPLYGDAKRAALAHSGMFALPSFSEGFSMAVLEAAAAGLPVLLTPPCNFPELARAGGAIEVKPDADGCAAGLLRLLSLSDEGRRAMGARGRELVAGEYNWTTVAKQMLNVYEWVLGRGEKPACVVEK